MHFVLLNLSLVFTCNCKQLKPLEADDCHCSPFHSKQFTLSFKSRMIYLKRSGGYFKPITPKQNYNSFVEYF